MSLLSLHSSHTQTRLLLDGLQFVRADGLRDQIQLLAHGLVAERHADVGNVGAPDVVPLLPFVDVVGPEPGALHLQGGAAGEFNTDERLGKVSLLQVGFQVDLNLWQKLSTGG